MYPPPGSDVRRTPHAPSPGHLQACSGANQPVRASVPIMEPHEDELPQDAKPTKETLKQAFQKHKDWLDKDKRELHGLRYNLLKKKAEYYSVRQKWEECKSKEVAIHMSLTYVRDAPASIRPALVQLPASFSHRAAPLAFLLRPRAYCCIPQGKKPPASPAKTKDAAASSPPAQRVLLYK